MRRLLGSTAMMPAVRPWRRNSRAMASTSVLFPAPGGPVIPTITACPARGCNSRSTSQRPRIAILDPGGGAGQRAHIAFRNLARPIRHQLFRSCRAITSRWISLVPSPMVQSFTSR